LTCSLGLLALGTDLKSRKGLYSGPSPIQNAHWSRHLMLWNDTCPFSFFFPVSTLAYPPGVTGKQKENYFCCGAIL
jgi:hypothetical protein